MFALKKQHTTKSLVLLAGLLVLFFPLYFAHAGLMTFLWNNVVLGLFGLLLWVGSTVLNFGINTFVIGFGDMFRVSGGMGQVVDELWVIIRNFFNLLFIFGLIYIGFKMILNSNDSNSKRWLVNLILAALLVNFSLFFSKFIVDVSNAVATEILNTGIQRNVITSNPPNFLSSNVTVDIGASLMDKLKITTVSGANNQNNADAFVKIANGKYDATNGLGYIFGSFIIILTATFVFFAAGIMLIIRGVALLLYMIFSPVMFLGWVLPSMSGTTKKYFQGFLKQAFFAPVYILFLYVTLELMNVYQTLGNANFTEFLANPKTGISKGANDMGAYIVMIVLLVGSLVAGKQLGATGASSALRIGGNLRRSGQKAIAGYAIARPIARAGRSLKRQYDRGGLARTATNIATLGYGRRALEGIEKTTISGSESLTSLENRKRTERNAANQRRRDDEIKTQRDTSLKTINTADPNNQLNPESAAGLNTAFENLSKTIRDMSDDELKNLDLKGLEKESFAAYLSENQIDTLQKSGNFSNAEIQRIKDARKSGLNNIARYGTPNNAQLTGETADIENLKSAQRANLFDRSAKDAGKLPVEIFKDSNLKDKITPAALEERMRNGGIKSNDIDEIRANIQAYLDAEETSDRAVKAWKTWSERNTFGSQLGLDFKNNATSLSQTAPAPEQKPKNPYNRFGDEAEANRYFEWEKKNNS